MPAVVESSNVVVVFTICTLSISFYSTNGVLLTSLHFFKRLSLLATFRLNLEVSCFKIRRNCCLVSVVLVSFRTGRCIDIVMRRDSVSQISDTQIGLGHVQIS